MTTPALLTPEELKAIRERAESGAPYKAENDRIALLAHIEAQEAVWRDFCRAIDAQTYEPTGVASEVNALRAELDSLHRQAAHDADAVRDAQGEVERLRGEWDAAHASDCGSRLYRRDVTPPVREKCDCSTPTPEAYEAACRAIEKHRASAEKAEQERDEARKANERDRSLVATAVTALDRAIASRDWMLEGRGPYEWDDPKYRDEFHAAARLMRLAVEPMRAVLADLSNCPPSTGDVREAKAEASLRATIATLTEERDGAAAKLSGWLHFRSPGNVVAALAVLRGKPLAKCLTDEEQEWLKGSFGESADVSRLQAEVERLRADLERERESERLCCVAKDEALSSLRSKAQAVVDVAKKVHRLGDIAPVLVAALAALSSELSGDGTEAGRECECGVCGMVWAGAHDCVGAAAPTPPPKFARLPGWCSTCGKASPCGCAAPDDPATPPTKCSTCDLVDKGEMPYAGPCDCTKTPPPAVVTGPLPGHTDHCSKRIQWGDGECECKPSPKAGKEGG